MSFIEPIEGRYTIATPDGHFQLVQFRAKNQTQVRRADGTAVPPRVTLIEAKDDLFAVDPDNTELTDGDRARCRVRADAAAADASAAKARSTLDDKDARAKAIADAKALLAQVEAESSAPTKPVGAAAAEFG